MERCWSCYHLRFLVIEDFILIILKPLTIGVRYVGGLIAAGVTYGSAKMDSTWAWRMPSALQGLPTILCIAILPFIPESPRWLADQGRYDECLEVVARTYANGRKDDPVVIVQHQEILDTIAFEKSLGKTATKVMLKDIIMNPSSRKRMLLSISVGVFSMLSGNNIVSFYLGSMLDNAGITNSTTQLEIVSFFIITQSMPPSLTRFL